MSCPTHLRLVSNSQRDIQRVAALYPGTPGQRALLDSLSE